MPRGVIDLARDRPPADRVLIATKASLVVRKDLHPAIQYLLLNTAREIHSRQNIFHRANEFPAAEADDIPLSDAAVRSTSPAHPSCTITFHSGSPRCSARSSSCFFPILGVLYPMMRFLPRLYDWAMRSKVLRMYGELRLLEDEMTNARDAGRETRELRTRLDRLEEQASHLRVPAAYASMLYVLRNHIDLVREGLRKHTDKAPEGVVARSE